MSKSKPIIIIEQKHIKNCLATWDKKLKFCIGIAKHRGVEILRAPLRVIVGTIHSVKGGEADTVIVYPDLSIQGLKEWIRPGEGRDSILH